MEYRAYSTESGAAWIFSDLLNTVARRGWFMAAPSAEDGLSLLYASFHIHPDDADRLFTLVQKAIPMYGGRTEWVLTRQQHNRFFPCPVQLALEAGKSGNSGRAAAEIRARSPELERAAALDLILLSDFLYKLYQKEGK